MRKKRHKFKQIDKAFRRLRRIKSIKVGFDKKPKYRKPIDKYQPIDLPSFKDFSI